MPELPEVEIIRQYLDQTALNHKIVGVKVEHPKVLEGSASEINQLLVGHSFTQTKRWGKNLFLLTNHPDLVIYMHFGMTGKVEYLHDSVELPPYTRVWFSFDNGYILSYISKRMFGRLGIAASVEGYVKNKSLAADALEIDLDSFAGKVRGRKRNIKSVLLDQAVTAGVGNWIADEILFQSGIHPTTTAQALSEPQIEGIFEQMREIIDRAISVEAQRSQLPDNYITHYGRKSNIECPRCGTEIVKTVVGGRGTYACETCQMPN